MRFSVGSLAIVLSLAVCGEFAPAQSQKPAPKAGTEVVRYVQVDGLLGELAGDAVLKETRQGGRVVSAVLDACHAVAPGSPRKDRFVVALRLEGQRLVGSGETSENRLPVSVRLERRVANGSFSFEGTIKLGTSEMEVASSDNSEMTEAEFRENRPVPAEPVASPDDFTDVSPSYVALKFKREALADVANWLRGQKVKIDFRSLRPTCEELRSGEQVVDLQIDAERAAGFIAASRGVRNMVSAGWTTTDDYRIDNAVRVAAAEWRDEQGALRRDKLAAVLSETIGKALSARPQSSEWDEVTGELRLSFTRASRLVPGLNLTESVKSTILVSPDKPGSRDGLLVWIGDPQINASDESSNPLMLGWASDRDDSEVDVSPETGNMVAATAEKLKGQRWDSEESAWK
jgi:hypothetical protein